MEGIKELERYNALINKIEEDNNKLPGIDPAMMERLEKALGDLSSILEKAVEIPKQEVKTEEIKEEEL